MTVRVAFAGLNGELVVELADGVGPGPVADACRLLLPGWGHGPAADAAPVDIAITATPGGYEIAARSWPGGAATASDANNLANALGGLLIDALLARHPSLCCLHAAAVTFAGSVILCVGRSGAGKSTLALRFAARGHTIFGDDRVLVETDTHTALSLGLAAKARLPLPPGDGLVGFAEARMALTDGGVGYLHLKPGEQAPFGRRAPIGAIVLVERDAQFAKPVEFLPLSAGPLAAGLIGEATAPGAAASVVAAVTRLARVADGRRLRYRDGDRAVDAMLRELALSCTNMVT